MLTMAAAAVFPGTAAAQVPDDVAARAFADAALRAAPKIAEASKRLAAMGEQPSCRVRVPRRHRAKVGELKNMFHVAHTIAGFTRAAGPAVLRASEQLHAVDTGDAVLQSGRTAWRRLRRD